MIRAKLRPIMRARSRWCGGSLIGQDGDEDEVVDTEDDFQHDQGQKTDSDRRIR
jgi:hypothetical protein